jgi:hypothetical protein
MFFGGRGTDGEHLGPDGLDLVQIERHGWIVDGLGTRCQRIDTCYVSVRPLSGRDNGHPDELDT